MYQIVLLSVLIVGCLTTDNFTIEDEASPISGVASKKYMTWQNRRLHTLNLYAKYDEGDPFQGTNINRSLEFFPNASATTKTSMFYSWVVSNQTAYSKIYFVNDPLGPETVKYDINTTMFELENSTKSTTGYTKYTFRFNASHIMMWVNEELAVKLWLYNLPADLQETKYFKFNHFKAGDWFKLFYYDPTVFCWHGCNADRVNKKEIEDFSQYTFNHTEANKDLLPGDCQQINCTSLYYHARCVTLYHTKQGEEKQTVSLTCSSENYTYSACDAFPDKPCWYEACDNYDFCNEATVMTISSMLGVLLIWFLL